MLGDVSVASNQEKTVAKEVDMMMQQIAVVVLSRQSKW
jgi:hypothetical protein